MAIHLLRDYLTQNITTNTRRFIDSYILTIFMRRVLTYSHVGSTNYPINAIGTLLLATGDTNPTGAASFPVGNKAGINIGVQKEFYVSIPISVRTVSGADIGRLLVLRSTAYPRYNSGVYLIVGFETSSNSYVIDYRTLGETPPAEPADSIEWWLYEKDINCPIDGASNTKASGSYRSDLDSTTPRILLQSPHPLGWQIRICNEASADVSGDLNAATGNCATMTSSPGFGGTAAGDFPAFGQHFHVPMWYNSNNKIYVGGAPGFGDIFGATGVQFRITIIGDDTGQGVVAYYRRPNNAIDPASTIVAFGVPENEPTPLPVNNVARLFVIGSGHMGNFGLAANRYTNDGGFQVTRVGEATGQPNNSAGFTQGMSASPFGTPVPAHPSMWAFISSGAQGTGIQNNFFATDTPFVSSTELLPIDIIQGTLHQWASSQRTDEPVYPYAPRAMGTVPHIRLGRANFGDFSPTTDFARSYQHLRRGLYIPWNGPNLIP